MIGYLPGFDGIWTAESCHPGCGDKILFRHFFEDQIYKHCLSFGIIKGFTDDICSFDEFNRIVFCEISIMCFDHKIRRNLPQVLTQSISFIHSDLICFILLTVEICEVYPVMVYKYQLADPRTGKGNRNVRT